MRDVFRANAKWQRTALALALLAAGLPFAARSLAGAPGAQIHVRWQSSVDGSTRQSLEAQFRLDAIERLEGLTWRYDLLDTSVENIRALVRHPAVADTHEIDRPNYTVAPSALRTARRERFAYGSGIVRSADVLSSALAVFAALITLSALTRRVPALQSARQRLTRSVAQMAGVLSSTASLVRRVSGPLQHACGPFVRFLQRAVPEIDAHAAGLFRVVFGATVLAYFVFPTHRIDASWLSPAFDPEVEGPVHAWMMEWFRARPFVVDGITPWLMVMGAAFVAGVLTRLSYALFVAGVLVWAYVATSVESTHPHSALVLTLVALLPARWGDAWSIDNWLRRRRGYAPPAGDATKRYGYTLWAPVLAFGVGFAAAAWAKLTVPPAWTSWILNGTIKYHIISDSAGAPVDWGLQLVRHPLLAIIGSFCAIAVESLVITAAFVRSERYRVTMGLAAVALLAGIAAFMGIVWVGWWIPLLAFLPWQHWSQRFQPDTLAGVRSATAGQQWLTAAQLIVVVFVIGQQLVVSALRLERAPMFSWYDMYSRSYADAADYNASIPPAYRIFVTGDQGRVQLRCSPHEELVRDFEAAVGGKVDSRTRVWRAILGCGGDLSGARYVTLEGTARTFDWDLLEFKSTYHVSLGPLAAEQQATGIGH